MRLLREFCKIQRASTVVEFGMNIVCVFPGQGSQHVGMGGGLFEKYRKFTDQANEVLGYSIEELCLTDGEARLNLTQYTQPAMFVVNVLSYMEYLEDSGRKPDYLAGHSLGEYCALYAAGAYDFSVGLQIVKKRGEIMSRAMQGGGMAAILKINNKSVNRVLQELAIEELEIANINSNGQCVLSGPRDLLFSPQVENAFNFVGAHFVPLNVSGAFHSSYMQRAQDEFSSFIRNIEFNRLSIPVISNFTARPYLDNTICNYLEFQLSNPVRWYESISWLVSRGEMDVVELGPGKVLTNLCADILNDPLPISDDGPGNDYIDLLESHVSERPTNLVFMFGGQGTQYFQMGKELYHTDKIFRDTMDACSNIYQSEYGQSLIDVIYDEEKKNLKFDNILDTHPALFSIGYSLSHVLMQKGFMPSAVVGHSLGEYIAATISGVMSYEDAMRLVIYQSQLVREKCRGAIASILAPVNIYYQKEDLFGDVTLAGVNSRENFFISGSEDDLSRICEWLEEKESIMTIRLPVNYGFHSNLIDPIKHELIDLASSIHIKKPNISLYSCVTGRLLEKSNLHNYGSYLWDIVRGPVKFDFLIRSNFRGNSENFLVDLSASASLYSFLKQGEDEGFSCGYGYAINQFGNNSNSLANLVAQLHKVM